MKKIKLSKKSQVRKRLLRNLLSSVILFEQVQTTTEKAKALKSVFESFTNKIKKMDNEVNAKRYINSVVYGGAKDKAYDYKDKFVGIKIFRVANRSGDNANQSIVQVILSESSKEIKEDKVKPKTKIKNDRA